MTENGDQIDLLELFAKLIFQIKRNAKLIILSFVVGTILGFWYFSYGAKVYETKMILLSDILTASYTERITESLDRLISEGNTKILSDRLNIPEQDVNQILNIVIESVKQNNGKDDKGNSLFIVTVKVLNKDILPRLQEGLITYLRNNEYVRIRVEQRKKYTLEIIKKIDEQLSGLEQLKSRITKGELTQGGKENLVLFDPTLVHTKIVELSKERANLQNALEIINSFQVVEGFTLFEKPVSPRLLFSLAAGASLGLFLVGVVIAFKVIRKMLKFSEERLAKP